MSPQYMERNAWVSKKRTRRQQLAHQTGEFAQGCVMVPYLICVCSIIPAITGKDVDWLGTRKHEKRREKERKKQRRKENAPTIESHGKLKRRDQFYRPLEAPSPFPRVLLLPLDKPIAPAEVQPQSALLAQLPVDVRLLILEYLYTGSEYHADLAVDKLPVRDQEYIVLLPCTADITGDFRNSPAWPGWCPGLQDSTKCGKFWPRVPVDTFAIAATCRLLRIESIAVLRMRASISYALPTARRLLATQCLRNVSLLISHVQVALYPREVDICLRHAWTCQDKAACEYLPQCTSEANLKKLSLMVPVGSYIRDASHEEWRSVLFPRVRDKLQRVADTVQELHVTFIGSSIKGYTRQGLLDEQFGDPMGHLLWIHGRLVGSTDDDDCEVRSGEQLQMHMLEP